MTAKEYAETNLNRQVSIGGYDPVKIGKVVGHTTGSQYELIIIELDHLMFDTAYTKHLIDKAYRDYTMLIPYVQNDLFYIEISRLTLLNETKYPQICPLCGAPADVRSMSSFDCSEGC